MNTKYIHHIHLHSPFPYALLPLTVGSMVESVIRRLANSLFGVEESMAGYVGVNGVY
jgi:hypothetical protein